MQHNRTIERVQRLLDSAVWLGGSQSPTIGRDRWSGQPQVSSPSDHRSAHGHVAQKPCVPQSTVGEAREDQERISAKPARLRPRAPTRTPGPLPRPAFRRAETLVRLRLHQQMAREVLRVVGTSEGQTTRPGTVIQRALAKTMAE